MGTHQHSIGTAPRATIDDARDLQLSRFDHLLSDVFRLESTGQDSFESAACAQVFDRLYGGQTVAQAALAAAATVSSTRPLHSLHAYFLRIGDPQLPLHFLVDRMRDTTAFSNRLVRVVQGSSTLATVMTSFHSPDRNGGDHSARMPSTPGPEHFQSRDERLFDAFPAGLPENAALAWPVEIRYVDREPWSTAPSTGSNRMWMRAPRQFDAPSAVHSSLLVFASDLTMYEPVIARHEIDWQRLIAGDGLFGASVDHSVWIHSDIRIDDWLLHVQESPAASGGRGLTTGRFFDRAGRLVASVAQEVVVRIVDGSVDGSNADRPSAAEQSSRGATQP